MRNDPVPSENDKAVPIEVSEIPSAALMRLIAEVREGASGPFESTLYNRTYHRHNR